MLGRGVVLCVLVLSALSPVAASRRFVPLSGGGGGHGSSGSTPVKLNDGGKGWPVFCKELGKWEPATGKEQHGSPCSSHTARGCSTEHCIWDSHSSTCMPKEAQQCKDMHEEECRKSRSKGCVYNATECIECRAATDEKAKCEAMKAVGCHWTEVGACHSKEHLSGCKDHHDETACNAGAGCSWNVSSKACVHTECLGKPEAGCKALTECHWVTGTCETAAHVECTGLGQASCLMESTDCRWLAAPACEDPHCNDEHNEAACKGVKGCVWESDKCAVEAKLECEKAKNTAECTAKGCQWLAGKQCLKHAHLLSPCLGASQADCNSLTQCKWEETSCSRSECTNLPKEQCEHKEGCTFDEHSQKCASKEGAGHDDHAEHPPPYNILVIFVIGALGAFFRHNFSGSKIPYTVILFAAGAAFDGIAQINDLSTLKNFVGLADIDPHLLFYIFLPVLIFESAFAVDWFVFKTVLGHCILLAGPGICVASGLTALLGVYCFNYDWTWEMSLLFGVTLSATDPVAVVALLKELGASAQISTLIEGESLLNDGTAIVFFTVLQSAVGGCSGHIEDSAGALIFQLIKVALGGPLLGYGCGMVAVFCLSKVFNDPLIEITTSLVTAYVTFFIAEAYCHVSGVLAVVACGVYMSYRKQCISPEVHHTLHEFWEMSVYLGNTLIFTMAGMIVAGKAFKHVGWMDVLYLTWTYAAINVIRFVCLQIFALIYNRFEYKLDFANQCLVAWGGLRGAVGLALALIVSGDSKLTMRDEQDPRTILQNKLVFFVSGIVVLTLVVNGTSTQILVKHFKLDQVSDTKKRMMRDNFKRLREGGFDQLEDLKTEGALYDVNWLEARKWVFDEMRDPYNKDEEFLGEGDQRAEAIMHYFKILHSSVWEQNEEGLLDGDAVRFLLAKINEKEKQAKKREADQLQSLHPIGSPAEDSAMLPAYSREMDVMEDQSHRVLVNVELSGGRTMPIHMGAGDTVLRLKQKIYREENIPVDQQRIRRGRDELENHMPVCQYGMEKTDVQMERRNPDENYLMSADMLQEFWVFDHGVYGHVERVMQAVYELGKESYLEQKWKYGFNVAMALVIAHDAVLAKIDNLAEPGEANKLKTHAKKLKREVLSQLMQIAKKATATSTAMKTTLAARTVLNHARSKVWEWQKEGLIEDQEARVLVERVEQKMKELTKADSKMSLCAPDYILSQMEWHNQASTETRSQLRSRKEWFARGQVLIEKGQEHDKIILITAGSARVHVSRRFDYVGPGYAAGLLSALTSTTKFCDVYAETDMCALSFKADSILKMMHKKGNEAFYSALWRSAGVDLAFKLLRGKDPYSKWAPREVRKFVNKGRLLELPKYRPEDKKVTLGHGCYHILISGIARDATNQAKDAKMEDLEIIEAPALLPMDCEEVYLHTKKWKISGVSQGWFSHDGDEEREDEVQILIVDDPSSASARARKYWEKIYKKIRSIKTAAALRNADVKTALAEAFPRGPDLPQYNGGDHYGSPKEAEGYNAGAWHVPQQELEQPLLQRPIS
eukprot:Sspe_Gene.53488::Locus_29557_Transcript_3_5_Confidence_0.222_Length_5150::g.53488::m.53488